MRIVIALGGNALASAERQESVAEQRRRIADAASAIADIARSHEVLITHGNGPQVGQLTGPVPQPGAEATPLDVRGAATEGMIGYWLESELGSIFPASEVATLLTQVEVAADDPAFERPDKAIGPVLSSEEADTLAKRFGFSMSPVEGGFRRVVPSPRPVAIRESRIIRRLIDAGVLVICAGGGGIPVVRSSDGVLGGVEAVVDKDRTAALLAEDLDADRLLLLTNVEAVYADWPDRRQPLGPVHPDALGERAFEPGTMGPKVEAACAFASRTGKPACIGALENARHVFQGEAGTWISTKDPS